VQFESSARLRDSIGFAALQFCFLISCVCSGPAETVCHGPSGYLSFTNSPFNISGFDCFHLETFEDGLLNIPGVTINSGWVVVGPGSLTDSVDGDDGSVNGAGINGYSLLSGDVRSNLVVTFDPNSLGGHLPTHAGIVCTDIGAVSFGQLGVGDVTFAAYDSNGVLLGSITATNLGNGSVAGSGPEATSEDRFFGISHPAGIASITLTANNSKDWEVDHLQYGYRSVGIAAPELRIRQTAAGEIVLTWPTNANGFTLQESPVLPGTNWITVPFPSVLVDEQNQVTMPPPSGNRFFRLSGS
jgi:hypothetical protein